MATGSNPKEGAGGKGCTCAGNIIGCVKNDGNDDGSIVEAANGRYDRGAGEEDTIDGTDPYANGGGIGIEDNVSLPSPSEYDN